MSIQSSRVAYSNGLHMGSVATYTCNDNYVLTFGSSVTRTCTTEGWTGVDATCTSKAHIFVVCYWTVLTSVAI